MQLQLPTLIVDDDYFVATALARHLRAVCTPLCSASVGDACATIDAYGGCWPLIVDAALGMGHTGFEVMRYARRVEPRVPTLVFSGHVVDGMLEPDLASAGRDLVGSYDLFSKPVSREIIRGFVAEAQALRVVQNAGLATCLARWAVRHQLTGREIQVLAGLVVGCQALDTELGISTHTLRHHEESLRRRTRHSTTDAMVAALLREALGVRSANECA